MNVSEEEYNAIANMFELNGVYKDEDSKSYVAPIDTLNLIQA